MEPPNDMVYCDKLLHIVWQRPVQDVDQIMNSFFHNMHAAPGKLLSNSSEGFRRKW